jgi:hypothetical protein
MADSSVIAKALKVVLHICNPTSQLLSYINRGFISEYYGDASQNLTSDLNSLTECQCNAWSAGSRIHSNKQDDKC